MLSKEEFYHLHSLRNESKKFAALLGEALHKHDPEMGKEFDARLAEFEDVHIHVTVAPRITHAHAFVNGDVIAQKVTFHTFRTNSPGRTIDVRMNVDLGDLDYLAYFVTLFEKPSALTQPVDDAKHYCLQYEVEVDDRGPLFTEMRAYPSLEAALGDLIRIIAAKDRGDGIFRFGGDSSAGLSLRNTVNYRIETECPYPINGFEDARQGQ